MNKGQTDKGQSHVSLFSKKLQKIYSFERDIWSRDNDMFQGVGYAFAGLAINIYTKTQLVGACGRLAYCRIRIKELK